MVLSTLRGAHRACSSDGGVLQKTVVEEPAGVRAVTPVANQVLHDLASGTPPQSFSMGLAGRVERDVRDVYPEILARMGASIKEGNDERGEHIEVRIEDIPVTIRISRSADGRSITMYETHEMYRDRLAQLLDKISGKTVLVPDPETERSFVNSDDPVASLKKTFIVKWFDVNSCQEILGKEQLKRPFDKTAFENEFRQLCTQINDEYLINEIIKCYRGKPPKMWSQENLRHRQLQVNNEMVDCFITSKLNIFFGVGRDDQGRPREKGFMDCVKNPLSELFWMKYVELYGSCRNERERNTIDRKYQMALKSPNKRHSELVLEALYRSGHTEYATSHRQEKNAARLLDRTLVDDFMECISHLTLVDSFSGLARLKKLAEILSEIHPGMTISDLTEEQQRLPLAAAKDLVERTRKSEQAYARLVAEDAATKKAGKSKRKKDKPAAASASEEVESLPLQVLEEKVDPEEHTKYRIAQAVASLGTRPQDVILHPRVARWLSDKKIESIRAERTYGRLDDEKFCQTRIDHSFGFIPRLYNSDTVRRHFSFDAKYREREREPIPVCGFAAKQIIQNDGVAGKPEEKTGVVYVAVSASNQIYHAYFEPLHSKGKDIIFAPQTLENVEERIAKGRSAKAAAAEPADDEGFEAVGGDAIVLQEDGNLLASVAKLFPGNRRVSYIIYRLS